MSKKAQEHIYSLLKLSVVSSIISSLSLLPCAFLKVNESFDKVATIVFPILFWLFFALEQGFFWKANSLYKKSNSAVEKAKRKCPGIFLMFRNKYAKVFDVIMILSFILCVVFAFFDGLKTLNFIFALLLILSFRLHCIFNSRIIRDKEILFRKVEKDV